MDQPIQRVILIPGLLEPPLALWPMKRALQKHCGHVECFSDRWIFRRIQRSIDRLVDEISGDDHEQSIAIVTHSFGDWVARQAIAQSSAHNVVALVSVAPVMRAGLVAWGLRLASANLIPEVKIITDPKRAAENLDLDQQVRRLVIWAKIDECIRSVPLEHIPDVERYMATHLSVILQPNILRRVEDFVFPT